MISKEYDESLINDKCISAIAIYYPDKTPDILITVPKEWDSYKFLVENEFRLGDMAKSTPEKKVLWTMTIERIKQAEEGLNKK